MKSVFDLFWWVSDGVLMRSRRWFWFSTSIDNFGCCDLLQKLLFDFQFVRDVLFLSGLDGTSMTTVMMMPMPNQNIIEFITLFCWSVAINWQGNTNCKMFTLTSVNTIDISSVYMYVRSIHWINYNGNSVGKRGIQRERGASERHFPSIYAIP